MATTEAGGIVPEELRERLIALFSWMNEVPIDSGSDVAVADDVLAEIAVAGYELVPSDRMERLRESHRMRYEEVERLTLGMPETKRLAYRSGWYHEGDLDRGEVRE
jgi:hypothetical protein